MENNIRRKILKAVNIALLYVGLTAIIHFVNLDSGPIQFRISEALCVLAMFTPLAIPGLTIGCLISNIITGCAFVDVIGGSAVTFFGAILVHKLRNNKWVAPLGMVVPHMIIIPWIIKFNYYPSISYFDTLITVGIGEFICAYVLGELLCFELIKSGVELD